MDTADTFREKVSVNNFELDVALITPGGAPGVPDEPVVQASGSVSAVADYEYGVIDKTKVSSIEAIVCVDDTARIGVNILVISRKNDGNRLLCNFGPSSERRVFKGLTPILDGNVGGLGGRVETVGRVVTGST